jgi:uncharacterized protein YejL (UPF0352 family)
MKSKYKLLISATIKSQNKHQHKSDTSSYCCNVFANNLISNRKAPFERIDISQKFRQALANLSSSHPPTCQAENRRQALTNLPSSSRKLAVELSQDATSNDE